MLFWKAHLNSVTLTPYGQFIALPIATKNEEKDEDSFVATGNPSLKNAIAIFSNQINIIL